MASQEMEIIVDCIRLVGTLGHHDPVDLPGLIRARLAEKDKRIEELEKLQDDAAFEIKKRIGSYGKIRIDGLANRAASVIDVLRDANAQLQAEVGRLKNELIDYSQTIYEILGEYVEHIGICDANTERGYCGEPDCAYCKLVKSEYDARKALNEKE